MKKTEKIEVRLSHEEKLDLAALAQSEGRTVSELIRDLITRYMSLTTQRLPSKKPWGLLAGMIIIGVLAGHLLTYAYTQHHAGLDHHQQSLEINQ